MKKILLVIGLAIISFGLIIAGIFGAIYLGQFGDVLTIKNAGLPIGFTVATFLGGCGAGIAAIASCFTSKTKSVK